MKVCKTITEFYHKANVTDDELAGILNRLETEGWADIEWDVRKTDESAIPPTYVVDAQRKRCNCLPNTPLQMLLLFLERINDIDAAKKHWRNALKIFNQ